MDLLIRHRDDALLVADKPSGLPTQAPRGGGENLFDRLREEHPYVGLHHRLDTPASGLVLFTLDRGVNAAVAAAFREHTVRRRYLVVVLGDPGPSGAWAVDLDGKPARTRWWRLATRGGRTALAVTLETGRTHQIRRHAAGAGHPVLGDRRHGGAAGRLWPRLALHAAALDLAHPRTGAPLAVRAPLPDDLTGLVARTGYSAEQPFQSPPASGGAPMEGST